MNTSTELNSLADSILAYLSDREMDYWKYFKIMFFLDLALDEDPEPTVLIVLLCLLGKEQQAQAYAKVGKSEVIETVSLWIRTKIARDKLILHIVGVLKTERPGDLRGAKLLEHWQEHALALFRFGHQRTSTLPREFCVAANWDWQFVERLARLLNKPPLTVEQLNVSRLQGFILRYWLIMRDDVIGKQIPPLCYCSDSTIAKLADIFCVQANVTSKAIRKTWERLGLRKSSRILCRDAYVQRVVRSGQSVREFVLTKVRHRK